MPLHLSLHPIHPPLPLDAQVRWSVGSKQVQCLSHGTQYRTVQGISSLHFRPPEPSQNGCYCSRHPLSSDGISTSLKPTTRVSRCLSVRYDGFMEVALHKLATGLAQQM